MLVSDSVYGSYEFYDHNWPWSKGKWNEQLTKVRCLYCDGLEILLATELKNTFPTFYSFSSIWQKCIFCLLCARHFLGHWWQNDRQHIPEYFYLWKKILTWFCIRIFLKLNERWQYLVESMCVLLNNLQQILLITEIF